MLTSKSICGSAALKAGLVDAVEDAGSCLSVSGCEVRL